MIKLQDLFTCKTVFFFVVVAVKRSVYWNMSELRASWCLHVVWCIFCIGSTGLQFLSSQGIEENKAMNKIRKSSIDARPTQLFMPWFVRLPFLGDLYPLIYEICPSIDPEKKKKIVWLLLISSSRSRCRFAEIRGTSGRESFHSINQNNKREKVNLDAHHQIRT